MLFLRESIDSANIRLIAESESKDLFIEGVFAQAEKKNRNGRIYPKNIMEAAVKTYVDNSVSRNRALGELMHPENRPMPNPKLASHLTTSLVMDGNDVRGKAKILETPEGNIVRGLLKGGVQLGVSTRGLGSVSNRGNTSYVSEDYMMTAVDIVTDPSAIDAWVQAVNESQEWLITDDGRIVEAVQKKIKKTKLTEEKKLELMQNFLQTIRG